MKVCMQEKESVMSALHSVAQAQLGPACRNDHKQDQHLAAIVCGMQQAERRKYLNMLEKQACRNKPTEETCRNLRPLQSRAAVH